MRFTFDDEQLALRDAVRSLLDKTCTPEVVRASWETDGFDRDRWRALAEMGVLGVALPEVHGGMGLDATWLVLLLEEAGRAALPEPLGPMTVAASLLADTGSNAVRDEWLPRIVTGDALVAAALPGLTWVEHAHVADLILVTDGKQVHAVTREDVELVEQPGLDRSRRRFTVKANITARTCIASSNAYAITAALDRSAVAEAAVLLGTAGKLIELATAYAKQREQFGSPIGSFQAVKHHLATALVRTEFARPAVYRAGWSIATGADGRTEHASMALTLAAQAAHLAARTALQVHGAIGYTDEHDLHLWLRRGLNPAAALR